MSTAATKAPLELMAAMASPHMPRAGPPRPVPRRASMTRSAPDKVSRKDAISCSRERILHTSPHPESRSYCARASGESWVGSARRRTSGAYPAPLSSRATAMPSPPLFPLPQQTATRPWRRSGTDSERARAMALAAFSMSVRDGIPISSMATRSASRTSRAQYSFIAGASSATVPSAVRAGEPGAGEPGKRNDGAGGPVSGRAGDKINERGGLSILRKAGSALSPFPGSPAPRFYLFRIPPP